MIGFQCQTGKGPEAHRSVLRKSSRCQCGCKKVVHATRSIVEWSAWSHRSLAAGTWPTQRYDSAKGGALHTGTTLAWSGCASTCGILARASQNDPCFQCCCVRRKWRALAWMNMLVWGSSKKTTDTHFAALAASDCGVIVHAPATRAVVEDRRARHYALICPGWACTNGIAWSRLAKCSFEGVDNPFVENFEQQSLEWIRWRYSSLMSCTRCTRA